MERKEGYDGFSRKGPVTMEALVKEYVKSMRLTSGLNTRRIYAAWDQVSGAGPFTLKKYFRNGTLYITLSSSVVRSQLYFQRDLLLEKINAALASDSTFTSDDPATGSVSNLVLR